jgi:transposase
MIAMKESGHKERDLCKRYNLGHSTISRWEKEFKQLGRDIQSESQPKSESQLKEERMKDLEFDVENLREELDILKAAVSLLCKKKSV